MRKLLRRLVKRPGLLWWRTEAARAMRARRRLKQRRRMVDLAKLRQRLRELLWNVRGGRPRRQGQRRRLLRLLEGRVRVKLKKLQGRRLELRLRREGAVQQMLRRMLAMRQ